MYTDDQISSRHALSRPRLVPTLAGATLSAACWLGAASADDTEIFFGSVDGSLASNPNVLFVLDTSGSMKAASDTPGLKRLDAMKVALTAIVDDPDFADINMGLMRFNGKEGGGAVVWPVVPRSGTVCVGDGCEAIGVGASVAADADDAEERLSSGAVSTDGYILSLGAAGANAQAVGLRFDELDIPQGATITSAVLDFVAYRDSGGASALTIAAETSDDAAAFSGTDHDLTSRTLTTAVPWTPEEWVANGSYSTADFSAALQEVVNRSGWCGGNAVALVVKGSGTRDAQSWRTADNPGSRWGIDPATAAAPRLRVSYNTAAIPAGGGCNRVSLSTAIASDDDDAEEDVSSSSRKKPYMDSSDLELSYDRSTKQLVGLRFDGVTIPYGATVLEAYISFVIDEKKDDGGEALSVLIRGESDRDADPYDADEKGAISKRKTVSTTIAWNDIPVHEQNDVMETPDISALVQQIIDDGDWDSGNAMGFTIEHVSGTGTRTVESYRGEKESAPTLHIRYKGQTPAGTATWVSTTDRLKEIIDEIDHASGTPIVDALYEAALYMRGEPVDYGLQRGKSSSLLATNRVAHSGSWSGGTLVRPSGCSVEDLNSGSCVNEKIVGAAVYDSPIVSSCQSNHIVLLTDGSPSSNSSADKVRDLTGVTSCDIDTGVAACGEEITEWLYKEDQAAHIADDQTVTTHTIGFNFSGSWLKSLADHGGGNYYGSTEGSKLKSVFEEILTDVANVNTSFVAPAATVNQFNRLTHKSEIYFAMFRPDVTPTWSGNLKRYKIAESDGSGDILVLDRDDNPAVDTTTGFFDDQARSFWNQTLDGSEVALGGAAARITGTVHASGREVYTFTGDSGAVSGTAVDLTADDHALHESNTRLTLAMLGLDAASSESDRRAHLEWARGVDTLDVDEDGDDTELRAHIGDPMHSRPVIVSYNDGANGEDNIAIYVATNEGFLHSIDSETGNENFAFIPKELLGNLDVFRGNDSDDSHPYGLDGSLSVWIDETDGNLAVDSGESAYLYAGMRRGGRNYYALDVSARLTPKLAWVIEGGTGDFAELGQSWSRPVPTRVMLDGVERDVVVFGAGYDTVQDAFVDATTSPRRAVDTVGRGLYIADAKTGEKLWAGLGPGATSADKTFAAMTHSVPGDIRVIDVDFDGLADQFWFGDMGGQIWRFDLASYHQAGDSRDFVSGGVVAALGGAGVGEERRFYYEPDVSLVSVDAKRSLAISIGSGWRAHPLDETVEDRFYVLRSDAIYGAPEGYGRQVGSGASATWRPITEADLVAVGGSVDPSTSAYGWYFDLPRSGEKVLGDSITVNNQVVFTSYRPDPTIDPCTPSIGGGSVYVLDIRDGSATLDMDGDGDIDDDDRSTDLAHGGIPPEPAALITEDGPTVLVGPEQPVEVEFDNLTQRSYWVEHGSERSSTSVVAEGEGEGE